MRKWLIVYLSLEIQTSTVQIYKSAFTSLWMSNSYWIGLAECSYSCDLINIIFLVPKHVSFWMCPYQCDILNKYSVSWNMKSFIYKFLSFCDMSFFMIYASRMLNNTILVYVMITLFVRPLVTIICRSSYTADRLPFQNTIGLSMTINTLH